MVLISEFFKFCCIVGVLLPHEVNFSEFFKISMCIFAPCSLLYYIHESSTKFISRFNDGTFSIIIPRANLDHFRILQSKFETLSKCIFSIINCPRRSTPTSHLVKRLEAWVRRTNFNRNIYLIVPKDKNLVTSYLSKTLIKHYHVVKPSKKSNHTQAYSPSQ